MQNISLSSPTPSRKRSRKSFKMRKNRTPNRGITRKRKIYKYGGEKNIINDINKASENVVKKLHLDESSSRLNKDIKKAKSPEKIIEVIKDKKSDNIPELVSNEVINNKKAADITTNIMHGSREDILKSFDALDKAVIDEYNEKLKKNDEILLMFKSNPKQLSKLKSIFDKEKNELYKIKSGCLKKREELVYSLETIDYEGKINPSVFERIKKIIGSMVKFLIHYLVIQAISNSTINIINNCNDFFKEQYYRNENLEADFKAALFNMFMIRLQRLTMYSRH